MSTPSSSSRLISHVEHCREFFITLENHEPSSGVEPGSSRSVVRSSSTALAGPGIYIYLYICFKCFNGVMLCERVTVTDVYRNYTIYEHVITQQLISDMESPICTRSLSSRNRCPACVHVTKQPSSEEWHIAVDPWFIVDACCCVVNHYLTRLLSDLLFELMCKQTLNTLIRIEGWFEVPNPHETCV